MSLRSVNKCVAQRALRVRGSALESAAHPSAGTGRMRFSSTACNGSATPACPIVIGDARHEPVHSDVSYNWKLRWRTTNQRSLSLAAIAKPPAWSLRSSIAASRCRRQPGDTTRAARVHWQQPPIGLTRRSLCQQETCTLSRRFQVDSQDVRRYLSTIFTEHTATCAGNATSWNNSTPSTER